MASTLAILSALSAGCSISERPHERAGRLLRGYPRNIPSYVWHPDDTGPPVMMWYNAIVENHYCIAPDVMMAMGEAYTGRRERPTKLKPHERYK